MQIKSISPVLPVDDMARAVAAFTALLGAAPALVDGDRWARFDIAGQRLALAGTDRMSDTAGVMIKVVELEAARQACLAAGLKTGEVSEGPHERRFTAVLAEGWPVTFYASRA